MKKAWLKYITSFGTTINSIIAGVPTDMPKELRESITGLGEPVRVLMGRLPAAEDEEKGLSAEGVEAISAVLEEQTRILAGVPKLIVQAREDGVAAAIKSGTHLAKESVQALVEQAKKDGAAEAQQRFDLMSGRVTILAGASLPKDISVDLLTGPEAAFTAAKDEAVRRAGVLKQEKLEIPEGKERVRLLFGISTDEFKAQVDLFKSIAGKGGSPGQRPNPLAAGTGKTGEEGGDKKHYLC